MTTPIPRLDRLMLVSLLVSGFGWLFLLSPPWTDASALFLACGTYVVLGSVAMAAADAQRALRTGRDRGVLFGLWFAAVLFWAVLILAFGWSSTPGPPEVIGALVFGLLLGTPCFALWQVVAFAIRGAWRWRSGIPDHVEDPWSSA